MKELRVGLVALAEAGFDLELAGQVAGSFRTQLILRGLKVAGGTGLAVGAENARAAAMELAREDFDLLLVLFATYSGGASVIALAEACSRPVFLWSVPEERTGGRQRLASLSGLQHAAHALAAAGQIYEHAYAPPGDRAALERLWAAAEAAQVFRRLKSARIGILGEVPAGGLEPWPASRLGAEIRRYPLEAALAPAQSCDEGQVGAVRRRLERQVGGLDGLDPAALQRALGCYVGLRSLAWEQKLDVLVLGGGPERLPGLECSACGAFSLLAEEKIPCSGAADAGAAVSQLVLQALGEAPACGADLISVDPPVDTSVLWSCGQAPLSMADPGFSPRAIVDPASGLPLALEFPLKPGRITLARLSQADGALRLVIAGGEILAAPPSFAGTSGVARFERPAGLVLDDCLELGLEPRLALACGDHRAALRSLAKLANIPTLEL